MATCIADTVHASFCHSNQMTLFPFDPVAYHILGLA